MMKKASFVICLLVLVTLGMGQSSEPSQFELPVVITTYGQTPGALMIRMVCTRNRIPCEQEDLLTKEMMIQRANEGKPYGTLIITSGTSGKGMGAAGVDLQFEAQRIAGLIEEAKKQGIKIIAAHVEGMARRVDSMDEQSINDTIPKADLIMVVEDSDSDGFFTNFSEKSGIPLVKAKDTLSLGPILLDLFSTN